MSMPSRASTSLLPGKTTAKYVKPYLCQCPHGLVPHCYAKEGLPIADIADKVSMPSRASTSLLRDIGYLIICGNKKCQCPHGLVPHCYETHVAEMRLIYMCQCPHGLVPHCYGIIKLIPAFIISLCQCPHGLVPHCYVTLAISSSVEIRSVNALTG